MRASMPLNASQCAPQSSLETRCLSMPLYPCLNLTLSPTLSPLNTSQSEPKSSLEPQCHSMPLNASQSDPQSDPQCEPQSEPQCLSMPLRHHHTTTRGPKRLHFGQNIRRSWDYRPTLAHQRRLLVKECIDIAEFLTEKRDYVTFSKHPFRNR